MVALYHAAVYCDPAIVNASQNISQPLQYNMLPDAACLPAKEH